MTPEQLVLENRKIKVVPIVRGRAFFPKGHDGEFMFTGVWKDYGLPINSATRSYFNPFKPGEQAAFEKLLNMPAGSLNINNRRSDSFWGQFAIRLDKDGKELDLSEVDHALSYRVLMVHPAFAKQNDDESNIKFHYKLVDERYVEEAYSKQSLKKAKAFAELNRIKSKKQLVDTLRLLGIKMNDSSSDDALRSKLAQIIDEPSTSKFKGLKTIDDFMNVMEDKDATTKLFVLDAIEAKEVLVEKGDEYRLAETGKLIGRSLQGAVDWFSDIANQETKLLIQERMKISG